MSRTPIGEQIREVERELAMRRSVYPHLIARGNLREGDARLYSERMTAVLATLRFVEKHQAKLRAIVEADAAEAER